MAFVTESFDLFFVGQCYHLPEKGDSSKLARESNFCVQCRHSTEHNPKSYSEGSMHRDGHTGIFAENDLKPRCFVF